MKVLKFIKIVFMSLLTLVVVLLLLLGWLGSGWGIKSTPQDHPFYSGAPRMIAHRGVSDAAPENTLAATDRALELGFEAMEIDIKESADQQFFLFHDRTGSRLLNNPGPVGPQDLDIIQQWPLYYNGQATDHRIPDLESFLSQYRGELTIYFDVKRHGNDRYAYLADKLWEIIRRHDLVEKAFVGSDFLFTAYLEYRYPELHTVFTGPGDGSIFIYHWIPKKFRPDFIISYAREVTPGHLEWLRRNDLMHRRMLYGVNVDTFQDVIQMGVPILVVDYHPVMADHLNQ